MLWTAIPFGYLFIALFLLATFVVGGVTFVVAWRRRSAVGRRVGAILCAFVVVGIVGEVAYDDELEWNPMISSDSQIVGTWTAPARTLILSPAHTFMDQADARTTRGTWVRDDWHLSLHGDSYSGTMRFTQLHGSYRLLTHPPNNPDMWDGGLGLQLNPR